MDERPTLRIIERGSLERALVSLNDAFQLVSGQPDADELRDSIGDLRDSLLDAHLHLTRAMDGPAPTARDAAAVLPVVTHSLALLGDECVLSDEGCAAILVDNLATGMYALERVMPDLAWYH